ncbi:MAG: T9SS type A sorting domain-containing protein [bacterium]|nr:T9SS type A sorting domain-containing protein [bacterium]
MKKFFVFSFVICLPLAFVLYTGSQNKNVFENDEEEANEHIGWKEYYKKLLADPTTGEIPKGIYAKEQAYAQTLPFYRSTKRSETWIARGPNNVGGRTRAFGINKDNANEMLAGAVAGGIFKSSNGGKSWTKVNCPVLSITCLVQDQRAGKTNIWYAGTGELLGASGSGAGAYYGGDGILKSTDGGNNWSKLASTVGTSSTLFDRDFDGVYNIVIDNSNSIDDELYAATYQGIYRSMDGGVSWTRMKAYSYKTDVAITANGVVYATLSSEAPQKGIWRSTDGLTWIKITPIGFPVNYGRIVIGIAPSDPNQVYFLAAETLNAGLSSTNFQNDVEWNSFWKYTYNSGDGSGAGGAWIDRSLNLPNKGGDFGQFNTQGGYDLYVKVKPDDANVIFLGAANLWRSTDGFTSNNNTTWIGGYAVNTTRPNYQIYKNHHPDNHSMVFFQGSNIRAVTAHDGGLSLTENVMAPQVEWEDLNNNYTTSLFYSIAIDHGSIGDNKVLGGLQDNGTQFMDQYGMGSWQMSGNSDGSFCFIKDGGTDVYLSAQQGRISHVQIDAIGRPIKNARIDPSQLYRSNYDFINPFSIDPNNQKILYQPAKTRLFRNTDIDAKALSTALDSTRWNTPLWQELLNCVPPAGSEFSAITTSRSQPNTVYYGTSMGKLFKVSNASIGQPTPINITGSKFSIGNLNCVATDPLDSNNMMVVFSNYGIISLFATEDGGISWLNVSGNLEENANGSGSGPSCRWAAVMPLRNGKRAWFVGTSTGLYATTGLVDNGTIWTRQANNEIGTTIVNMIDVRPQDYYIAAATHGAGVFSANIAEEWQTTAVEKVQSKTNNFDFTIYPNPCSGELVDVILKTDWMNLPEVKLYNTTGQEIKVELLENNILTSRSLRLNITKIPTGMYWLQIKSQGQTAVQKLTILR